MPEPNFEFSEITTLVPEAMGEAGQRTFRIIASTVSSSAIIQLEKEQLFQLALAINQLLGSADIFGESTSSPNIRESLSETKLEFNAEKLTLAHEIDFQRFIIDAHDIDVVGQPPKLRIWITYTQIKEFADEALKVCAAGRPLCPMCGNPMDKTGHKCANSNGHRPIEFEKI